MLQARERHVTAHPFLPRAATGLPDVRGRSRMGWQQGLRQRHLLSPRDVTGCSNSVLSHLPSQSPGEDRIRLPDLLCHRGNAQDNCLRVPVPYGRLPPERLERARLFHRDSRVTRAGEAAAAQLAPGLGHSPSIFLVTAVRLGATHSFCSWPSPMGPFSCPDIPWDPLTPVFFSLTP